MVFCGKLFVFFFWVGGDDLVSIYEGVSEWFFGFGSWNVFIYATRYANES